MPRIAVLVSNDLEYDQRVARICEWLRQQGMEITLVGRMLPSSRPLNRPYRIHRFRLLVQRGPLFYAALNLRLFIWLLFRRVDLILANDLDTLLPAFLVSRLRGLGLVYDSHEYFTGAEGLSGSPFRRRIWEWLEGWIFPRLRHVYTVNATIAALYSAKYGVTVRVVRNIPAPLAGLEQLPRESLGIPPDRKILILQGAYIDPDRGGRELALAMRELPGCHLYIIGSGRDWNAIADLVGREGLQDRVTMMPRMSREKLWQYTSHADIGCSLDKPVHPNYAMSLPNKFFDYLHAGVPVLVSALEEPSRLVREYGVGAVVEEVSPRAIAAKVREMLASPEYPVWKENAARAARELTWENETRELGVMYAPWISPRSSRRTENSSEGI